MITGEGLQILTNARHLCSECSLACHMGHPFIVVISDDTHTYCRAFGSGAVFFRFNDFGLSRPRFDRPTLRLVGTRSNRLRYHDS